MSSSELYTIIVRTGERLFTATDLQLSITLLGRQANLYAGPFSLKHKRSLIERHHGNYTEVHRGFDATKDIGDIVAMRLEGKSGWRSLFTSIYIEYIQVRQPARGQHCYFAVYSWIRAGSNRIFFCGPAQLPNSPGVSVYMKTLRSADLAYWQTIYDSSAMVRQPGLPVGMSARYWDLPDDEQFCSIKGRQMLKAILSDILDTTMASVFGESKSWDSYDELKSQFTKNGRLPTPIAEIWDQDATMGRCYVSGLNPSLMKLCVGSFPEGFPITIEDIETNVSLFRGRNIQDDLKNGRFCYVDYRPLMQNVVDLYNECRLGAKCRSSEDRGFILNTIWSLLNWNKSTDSECRYIAAPVCVLYWNDRAKCLVPVAIQLKKDGKLYFPVDDDCTDTEQNEWLLAKMWVGTADTQIHQLQTHFLRSHIIIESFSLAMRRSLSPAHPLYRLLKPHLVNVMAINALARQRLLALICKLYAMGPETISFIEKCFELWSTDDMCPKTELENNGFDDHANTPLVKEAGAYPWREDVLEIWDAIEEYVTGFVSIYYSPKGNDQIRPRSDKDCCMFKEYKPEDLQTRNELVMADTELAHFRLELQDLLPGKTFPEFRTTSDVIQLAARIIYMASAGHSAINFNQYEHYAWQPHHPLMMRLPIPEEIGQPITERVILDSIPSKPQTVQAIAIARALSEYSPDEVYLGRLGNQDLLHSDPQARAVFDKFNHRLELVTRTIKARNATGIRKKNPYVYLLPSMVPSSVAI